MSKVPKLRFPEFKGEWEEKELGEVLKSISNGLSLQQNSLKKGFKVTRIETISDKKINIEKVGYIDTKQDLSDYKLVIGDILFSNINSLEHIGKSVIVDKDYNLYHGMNLLRLVVTSSNIPKFVYYQITLDKIQNNIRNRANRAINQASINQSELQKIPLCIPSIEEQQKIADCLSSLDELIEARREKIASLKAYKKGLLQQLFPEKVSKSNPPPLIFNKLQKLRFIGFEGEWEEVKLGEIMKIIKGEQKNKLSLSNTGKYYVMNGGITPSGYTNSYNTDKDTISISEGGNSCGYIQYNKEKFWSGGHCYTLHIYDNYKNKIDNFYLYQYLKAKEEYIMGFRVGSGLPNIQKITLQNVTISFPSLAEQQKIANCLLSLDEKIAAETEQVTQLQQHKKGLLQQLLV